MKDFPMKIVIRLLIILMLFYSGCCSGWKKFSSAEGHFSVDLPGTPEELRKTVPDSGGSLIELQYKLSMDKKTSYQIKCSDIPADAARLFSPENLLKMQKDEASFNNLDLVSEELIRSALYPGCKITFNSKNTGTTIHRQTFIAGRRMFSFDFIHPDSMLTQTQGDRQRFFGSIRIGMDSENLYDPNFRKQIEDPEVETVPEPEPVAEKPADSWRHLRSKSLGFEIGFPGEYTSSPKKIQSAEGLLNLMGYSCHTTEDGITFLLKVSHPVNLVEGEDPVDYIENFQKFFFKEIGGLNLKSETVNNSGAKGINTSGETESRRFRCQIFHKGNFLYQVMAFAPKNHKIQGDQSLDRFFKSFRILF